MCVHIATPDTPLAVQAGELVDAVDHPLPRAQRPPQLVQRDEPVPQRLKAAVGEGLARC